MPEDSLQGFRILMVEDGPVGTLDQAMRLIAHHSAVDGAILDVNLGDEMIYPVEDLLVCRETVPVCDLL